jgi:hypothetical protein
MQSKTLFSLHYMQNRLQGLPEWREDPRQVFEAVHALWHKARPIG